MAFFFLAAGTLLFLYVLGTGFPYFLYVLTAFFSLLMLWGNRQLRQGLQKTPGMFVASVMGFFGIKMFLSLAFIAVYAFLDKAYTAHLVLTGTALYFISTAMLVAEALRQLRSS